MAQVWVDNPENWIEVVTDKNFQNTIPGQSHSLAILVAANGGGVKDDEDMFIQKPISWTFGYEVEVILENESNKDAKYVDIKPE